MCNTLIRLRLSNPMTWSRQVLEALPGAIDGPGPRTHARHRSPEATLWNQLLLRLPETELNTWLVLENSLLQHSATLTEIKFTKWRHFTKQRKTETIYFLTAIAVKLIFIPVTPKLIIWIFLICTLWFSLKIS